MAKFAKLNRELSEKVELQLPNGSILRSKFLYGKGGFWRSYYYVNKDAVKEQMPLVGCLSSNSEQHLFCYDFDKLPAKYPTWEALYDALQDLPGLMVARSPSNKVKAFFVFTWKGFPDKHAIIERAYELLPQDIVSGLDRLGCFTFLMNVSIKEALKDLDKAVVFDWASSAGLEKRDSNIVWDTSNPKKSYQFSYHLADEATLPAELKVFVNKGTRGSEARLKFCRILVAMFGLSKQGGFSLPVASLADACGVDAGSVSAWLSWFKKAGFLSCVSSSYIVGLKAKSYEARGVLLEAINKRKETYNYATTLPKQTPKDGEFYQYFLHLSKKVPVLRDYKLILNSVPGITENNRYQMALRIFQCDRIKESRVVEVK